MIGKLERVKLKEVWPHEALDFTPWLEDNVEVLNEVLDLNLSNVEREKSAGAFNVDLVAEDGNGKPVVIENQLEKSDHDHLGKLVTYLTSLDALTGIWIVADPRPEHVNAITWLNESSSASFYLLKVEAIRIDDSNPAPLLTLIVGPSEEGRVVGKTKKEMAERYQLRRRFWAQLLDRAKPKTKLHANISPSSYNWIAAGAGRSGLSYCYTVTKHKTTVGLDIERGKGAKEDNHAIFNTLAEARQSIEQVFGGALEWKCSEEQQACHIRKQLAVGGYRDDEEKWPQIHQAAIDAMIRLEKALGPFISKLAV